jgi:hypothetical protein
MSVTEQQSKLLYRIQCRSTVLSSNGQNPGISSVLYVVGVEEHLKQASSVCALAFIFPVFYRPLYVEGQI